MTQPKPAYVFEVDGDVAVPTELARGPWSPHAQHGGAPAALLAGLLERFDLGTATFPARFTLELMRPVPLMPLRIERQTIRPGKKVQLVQGSLFADDVEVVRATLLRLREQPVEFADDPLAGEYEPMPPPGPPQPLIGSGRVRHGHRVLEHGRGEPRRAATGANRARPTCGCA